jgi:hypothetical protein
VAQIKHNLRLMHRGAVVQANINHKHYIYNMCNIILWFNTIDNGGFQQLRSRNKKISTSILNSKFNAGQGGETGRLNSVVGPYYAN